MMNTPSPSALSVAPEKQLRQHRRHDPILQELYEVRAKLNAEAGYSVTRLMEIVQAEAQKFSEKPAPAAH